LYYDDHYYDYYYDDSFAAAVVVAVAVVAGEIVVVETDYSKQVVAEKNFDNSMLISENYFDYLRMSYL
jgi:hypothetical protein